MGKSNFRSRLSEFNSVKVLFFLRSCEKGISAFSGNEGDLGVQRGGKELTF